MQTTEKYTEQVQGLFAEFKNYLALQKQYIALDAADKLTAILSAIAVAAICLLLGGMALLFCLLALAIYIGQVTGSYIVGLLVVFALLALVLFLFYVNRIAWVAKPIATLIIRVLADKNAEAGDTSKQLLSRDIEDSRNRINTQFQALVTPAKNTAEKAQSASQLVSRGFAIYQGVRIGLNVMKVIRNLFGKRGRRRWEI